MNGLFQTTRELTTTALPVEFEALAPPPLLLSGEQLEHYHALRRVIFADLAPQSAIEWLLAIDVAELSWDIQRYRMCGINCLRPIAKRRWRRRCGASTWSGSIPASKRRPSSTRCKMR